MSRFSVWAPKAKRVELLLQGERLAMQDSEDGWRFLEVGGRGAGMDYGYMLDGGDPLPDPRSPWQPAGVHGLSRTVDHDAFPWTDHRWQPKPLAAAVVYELHVGTFTPAGTFEAVIDKLDHLLDLGITHIELMPVCEFPGSRGWGYDGVDLYAPHHEYGGPEGLKRLVDACHGRGLAVLLDVVYNHLGPAGNYLDRFADYFTDRYVTPWGCAVNFDGPGSATVRRFFCDNALMWLRDYHFDGLRLDAVHAIFDFGAVHFLEQLAGEVVELEAQIGRHLVLVAESDLNDPRLVWSRQRGGYGLDAQWSDDFHHAVHALLTGERGGYYRDFGALAHLAKAFEGVFVYDGAYSSFRRRPHGRPPAGLTGHSFLAYSQNHDQVGNRARGERSGQLMSAGRLKIAAALTLLSPFVPMLFQGEEWGASTPFLFFTDHEDPELGRAVTEGRRKEFAAFDWKGEEVPDPQSRETFERSKLNWDERNVEPHAGILDWYRALITLRRGNPFLTDGRLDRVRVSFDEGARWLVVRRAPIAVACNLSSSRQAVPARGTVLLSSEAELEFNGGSVLLGPDGVAVLDET